jgi:hypothetical protein
LGPAPRVQRLNVALRQFQLHSHRLLLHFPGMPTVIPHRNVKLVQPIHKVLTT